MNQDLLKSAALAEGEVLGKFKDEVYQYLTGEKDISVLEPHFEEIRRRCYNDRREELKDQKQLDDCIKENPKFLQRYIALKCIESFYFVSYKITHSTSVFAIDKVARMLIDEKVPMEYRFSVYKNVYGWKYKESGTEIEEKIAKVMSENSETLDAEYEKYCGYGSNGDIFENRLYLRYMELTNGESNKNKDKILNLCADSRREIRGLAKEIIIEKHKDCEEDVLKMLKAKKQAVREAAADILSAWGVEQYRDVLLEAAKNEKSAKLANKLKDMLSTAATINIKDGISPREFVEKICQDDGNHKVLWLYETPTTEVHFRNGEKADEIYIQAMLTCYASMEQPGINENAALLAKELEQGELQQFAEEVFSKWIAGGAEAKKKWVLYFSSIHGGHKIMENLLQYIEQWTQNARGAIAAEAVRAIALNGSSEALVLVDNIAQKFKHKQVKNAAIKALCNAAEELGITSDELADKVVPTLGFNEKMERIFDYGPRKFKVYLTPALELEIFDEENKKRKSMPAPAKKDDEEIARQSNTEFKQLKKQLKNVIAIQKLRLETALLADRRWTMEAWQHLFVKNPVMHSFAIGLIWAAYEENQLVQTFRYMEDGSFNTSEEEEYTLSPNAVIGLVHPIDISEEELSAWKEQLKDYEIVQPIEQLNRKVYPIKEEEKRKIDLSRFHGRKISAATLLGRAEKLGWYKGFVEDAGMFYAFYREDVVKRVKKEDGTIQLFGNAAELSFSGMNVNYDFYGEQTAEIENIRFYVPGTVKYGGDRYDSVTEHTAVKLDQVNPRYFSEIINQLEIILKKTEKE